MARPPRWSWTTMWAAAIVVLLPTLAWLQYSWLDQIAVADRDRRERTVRTAAAQLAQEFDLELNKALFALQIDGSMLEPRAWAAYAERYSAWATSAANPRMVQGVYLATDAPGPASALPLLRRWNATTHTFDDVSWPDDMRGLAARVATQLDQVGRAAMFRRGDRPPAPLVPDDIGTLMAPIVTFDLDDARDDHHAPDDRRRQDVRLAGFTLVRLDLAVVTHEMVPAFVARHFSDEGGHSDFRVAVVDRDEPSTIVYESEPGAAAAALDRPDAATPLMAMHARPFFMFTRGERGTGPGGPGTSMRFESGLNALPTPPGGDAPGDRVTLNIIETRRDDRNATVRTRVLGSGPPDGHWRLVAKHRAGSLEAAVSGARTRNFALSTGVLLLLSAAIGLILVSARRADRLGRQQMEFVATVSHELRTPVSVIGAAAGNLADGVVADPSRVRQYGETIQTEARRLAETVERVLQLAGIASGRSMSAVTLAPATLIDEALQASQTEIENAGFDVDVDVPDHLPLIAGDRTALRSAVQNLIGNAVKYGREARWLRISAEAISGSTPAGVTRGAHGVVQIVVEDRGPGIPEADRAHIFEAFYRGRHAVSHQIHGSGLGLHLVQRIVEAHGGRVTVSCDPGPGCRFTITLPAAQPPSPRTDAAGVDVLTETTTGRAALDGGRSR